MSTRGARLAACLLWLGLATGVLAGEAAEPPPAPEPPPAEGPPAEPPPARGPAGEIRLNFKNASLDTVLQHLSEVTGLAVVTDAAVDGRITVVSRQVLDVEGAIALLDAALKEKGYAAVRTGRVLKIVTLAAAKKANIPVRSGSDPQAIVPSDRLVTQVIPLRSVDAVKLKEDLKPLIAEYADLSSNASSNALILTDTEANIRRIVEIVSALDTSRSTVTEVKVFPLKYADAASAAKLINNVFEVEEQQQRRQSGFQSPFSRFFGRSRGGPSGRDSRGGDQSGGDESAYQPQKVVAAADDRTNTVVVSGPTDTLKVVESVVKELDANPQDEEDVLIYRLKNADAANLEAVLTKLFEESGSESTALRTSAGGGGRQAAGGRMPGGPMPSPFGGAPVSEATAASASDLAGQVRVVADGDTNTLMLMAAPKHFEKLRTILAELDRPVPQVLIKVLIAEVTHENAKDIGVEFSILNLDDDGEGCELFTDFGVADATGGLVYKCVRGDVGAAIRLLETVGNLDVLSRPYILTSDNKEATITVGQEVPFIRDTRTTETGQTINTIQYEDIGIILKVTPHINPEGLVIMDVEPEISTLTGTTVPISETVDAEVFAKRSATSRVAIRNGQTIVIGGLMEDRKTDTIRKVPLLGDLPKIGFLFRRTIKTTVKTELLIFLTPQVAEEAQALRAISDAERRRTKLVPNAVSPGTFEEHIRGMGGDAAEPQDEKPAVSPAVKPEGE